MTRSVGFGPTVEGETEDAWGFVWHHAPREKTSWIVGRPFADEAGANAEDPVLRMIEHEARRKTLIAEREERGGEVVYRLDIRLQGEGETVFFDF